MVRRQQKQTCFQNVKRVKIPIKGEVCTREGGLTTQSNGGEQQFARAVIITRAALPPLCLQSMAIALRGSGDIIIEWLSLACVFLCVCVALVVMTTEQEWHVEALASCCCCGHWSLSRAQTFRPAIHRGARVTPALATGGLMFIYPHAFPSRYWRLPGAKSRRRSRNRTHPRGQTDAGGMINSRSRASASSHLCFAATPLPFKSLPCSAIKSSS